MHVRTCRKRSVPLYDNSQSGVGAVGQSSSGSAVTETHSGATITSVTMTVAFPQGRKAAGDPVGVTMTSDNPQCRKAAGSPQCREAAGDQTREFNNDYPRGRKVKGSRVRGGVPSAVGSAGSSRAADPGEPRGLAVPGGVIVGSSVPMSQTTSASGLSSARSHAYKSRSGLVSAPDDATGSCGADGASQMPAVGGSDWAGVACSIPNREVQGLPSALPPGCDSTERVIMAEVSVAAVTHTGPDASCVEPGTAGGALDSSVPAIPGEAPSWMVMASRLSSDSSRVPWRGVIMAEASVAGTHTGPDASCVEAGIAGGALDSSVPAIPVEAPSWMVMASRPSADSSRVPPCAVSHTVPSSGKEVIKADVSAVVSAVHIVSDASCVEAGTAGGALDSSVPAIPVEAPSWMVPTGPLSSVDSSRVPPNTASHTATSAVILDSACVNSSRSPPRSSGGDQSGVPLPSGCHTCGSCRRTFKTFTGMRVHERSQHPAEFHSGLAAGHRTGNKRRWSYEEKVMVAREELKLLEHSERSINLTLALAFPDRTFEAIKCLRKNPAYRAMRDGLRCVSGGSVAEGAAGDVTARNVSCVTPSSAGGETLDPSIPASAEEAHEVLANMCRTDSPLLLLSPDEVEEVVALAGAAMREGPEGPACNQLQTLVDKDYDQWIESLLPSQSKASSADSNENAPVSGSRSKTWRRRRTRAHQAAGGSSKPPSKKMLRRRLYGVVQALYRKNRSRCAKEVLSGDWAKEKKAVDLEKQESFWKPLFEEPSKPDARLPHAVSRPLFELSLPVALEEYERALQTANASSPGLDGVSRKVLRSLDAKVVVARMNLWLLACRPPSAFKEGVTVPLPKSAGATDPAEFRPITMGTMVCRLFHRLLAHRSEGVLPLGSRQKAFREGDGLADNVWILRSILDDHKARHRPLCVTFVDVRKAFDTVSHESVVKAAERIGFPPALVTYIRCLYTGGVTRLRVGGGRALGALIHPSRGVRQGDPLSPLLFCAVMHWVLSQLDDRLGLELPGGVRVNHLAFADDVALLSASPIGMERLLSELESGMREVGLRPNPTKSASLRIAVSGKEKRWFCPAEPYLLLDGARVPTIDVASSYRYLGVPAGLKGGKIGEVIIHKLEEGVRQLSKAPLKPQQRLYLLRVHLLPSVYHGLVLGKYSKGLTRYPDRLSRKAIRRWLHLPHDVPQSFFHAAVTEGGLGIPELLTQVPLMRQARVEKLFDRARWDHDPVLAAVIGQSKTLLKERQRFRNGVSCYDQCVTDRAGRGRATAAALHNSCDGHGLAETNQVPGVSRWVASGTNVVSGRSFVGAVHIRAGCLYTKARAARGRSSDPAGGSAGGTMCEVCPCRRENLAHVLQQCPRSASARMDRHNAVAKLFTQRMASAGWTVETEPAIRTDYGIRRPDVVAYKPGNEAVIVDVAVVCDIPGSLKDGYTRKCRKYDDPQVRAWAAEKARVSTTSVSVKALIFNWRGALCSESARDMKELGIPMSTLEVMSLRVLEWGHTAWKLSRDATWIRLDAVPRGQGSSRNGRATESNASRRIHVHGPRPPRRQGPPVGHAATGGWLSRAIAPGDTARVARNPGNGAASICR